MIYGIPLIAWTVFILVETAVCLFLYFWTLHRVTDIDPLVEESVKCLHCKLVNMVMRMDLVTALRTNPPRTVETEIFLCARCNKSLWVAMLEKRWFKRYYLRFYEELQAICPYCTGSDPKCAYGSEFPQLNHAIRKVLNDTRRVYPKS